ncbi:MAG: hypothetical protein AB7D57_02205 [Desulfovibrionaceae bacterium]
MPAPPRDPHELSKRLAASRKPDHRTRNAAIALAMVILGLMAAALFFGTRNPLKMMSAVTESVFLRKIVYTGALKEPDLRLPPDQLARLNAALDLYTKQVKQIRIWAEKQDSYAPMRPGTELRFQVTVLTRQGEEIKSVMTRATQGEFVERLLWRLKEDASRFLDYKKLHEKAPVGSFTNTM